MCLWLGLVVIVSASALAQDRHPLQARLAGQWKVSTMDGTESTELLQFLALAETNMMGAGENFRETYASGGDNALSTCRMAGALAGDPTDFSILDRGDVIDLTAFGRTRRVSMDFDLEPPDAYVPNELGWSVGRWVGDMLVIRTRHFSEGAIRLGEQPLPFGTPLAQLVERYTLSEDGNRLSLAINLNDPEYYLFSLRVRHEYVRTEGVLSSTGGCVRG